MWSVRELTSWNGGGTDTIDYISGFITQIEPWEVRGAENMGRVLHTATDIIEFILCRARIKRGGHTSGSNCR